MLKKGEKYFRSRKGKLNTLYEKTTLYRRETQRSAGVRKGIKIKDKKSGRIFRIRRSSDHMVRRTSGYDELSGRV